MIAVTVSCDMPTGARLLEGDDVTLESEAVPQSADVVFVVSHGDCNSEIKDRLSDMVTLTDKVQFILNLKEPFSVCLFVLKNPTIRGLLLLYIAMRDLIRGKG